MSKNDLNSENFLKRNDLATLTSQAVPLLQKYKGAFIFAVLAIFALIVGLPLMEYLKTQKMQEMSAQVYEAKSSLKKESLYKDIVASYADLPASHLVRILLADEMLSHDDTAGALQIMSEGLEKSDSPVIWSLLALKKIDITKNKSRTEALTLIDDVLKSKNLVPQFKPSLLLLKGDYLVLENKVAEAQKIYEALISPAGVSAEALGLNLAESDEQVKTDAETRLRAIKVNVLP